MDSDPLTHRLTWTFQHSLYTFSLQIIGQLRRKKTCKGKRGGSLIDRMTRKWGILHRKQVQEEDDAAGGDLWTGGVYAVRRNRFWLRLSFISKKPLSSFFGSEISHHSTFNTESLLSEVLFPIKQKHLKNKPHTFVQFYWNLYVFRNSDCGSCRWDVLRLGSQTWILQ